MINGPKAVIGPDEAMSAFAIGIVDYKIKQSQPAQGQGEACIGLNREVVLLVIVVDVELDTTNAACPITQDGGGHQVPVEEAADLIGCRFAQTEATPFKIPQWAFATPGLVHDWEHEVSGSNGG